MPRDGQFEHLAALLEPGDPAVRLVRRVGARHEPDLVEPGLVAALLGQDQVAHVDRVERAAEDADAHDAFPRPTGEWRCAQPSPSAYQLPS